MPLHLHTFNFVRKWIHINWYELEEEKNNQVIHYMNSIGNENKK